MHNFLLAQGAPEDIEDDNQKTPVQTTFLFGRMERFSYSLEDYIDDLSFTPLHVALVLPSYQIQFCSELLQQEYMQINTKDSFGMTPLHWACNLGNSKAVVLLLEWEADVNLLTARGSSALHEACRGGQIDCVRSALDAGCPADSVSRYGQTPLSLVGDTDDAASICELLFHQGADVNHVDHNGHTALHWAVLSYCPNTVALYLGLGANINAVNNNGDTPMHVALYVGSASCVRAIGDAAKRHEVCLIFASAHTVHGARPCVILDG